MDPVMNGYPATQFSAKRALTFLAVLLLGLVLTGCNKYDAFRNNLVDEPIINYSTHSFELLRSLPPPSEKAAVAVYNFDDQTGQFKPSETITEYSSAVTKGGLAILNNALIAAGNKQWFTVVERGGLKNIIQERQIIRAMREQYRLPDGTQLPDIPPMLYAGMLIEGGIIGYDTNTHTGGLAANYFGIGGTSEYRSDTVTIYLRAINIQTGEVLISVTSAKTIYSLAVQANVFRYISFDRLLQAETGFSLNEPVELATRQAIETAVYSMIMEGALSNIWSFADPAAGQKVMLEYMERRDGELPDNLRELKDKHDRMQEQAAMQRPEEVVLQEEPAAMAAPVSPISRWEESAPPRAAYIAPATPAYDNRVADSQLAETPPPVIKTMQEGNDKGFWSSLKFWEKNETQAEMRNGTIAQPTQPAPEYRAIQPAPIPPPYAAPEAVELAPAEPEPEYTAPKSTPGTVPVVRTSDPNAIVRYLNRSRYNERREAERDCYNLSSEDCRK